MDRENIVRCNYTYEVKCPKWNGPFIVSIDAVSVKEAAETYVSTVEYCKNKKSVANGFDIEVQVRRADTGGKWRKFTVCGKTEIKYYAFEIFSKFE